MPDHAYEPHRDGQAVNPDTQHEARDVNVRVIVWFGVGLIAFGVVAHLLALAVFDWLYDEAKRQDKPLSALAKQERPSFSPESLKRLRGRAHDLQHYPLLQENEVHDLNELRAEEDAQLNRYGWVNREEKTAHVPINVALKQMADPTFAAKHGIRVRPREETERLRGLEAPLPAVTQRGGGQ
jgi:hypothetical protein